MAVYGPFKVTIANVACVDGPQFWVFLENSNLPKNISGTIPSVHHKREDAQDQGRRWAKFLQAELVDNTFDVAHRSI